MPPLTAAELQLARDTLRTLGPIPPNHPELAEWEERLRSTIKGDDHLRRAVIALAHGLRPDVVLDTPELDDGKPWDDRPRGEKLSPTYGSALGDAGRWPTGGGRRIMDKPGGQEG